LGKRQKNFRGTGAAAMSVQKTAGVSAKWIWFVDARYIFRKEKKSPSPVFSLLGIATGVFALIVIIAVMNGFQLGFIESILEISSYHIRIGNLPAGQISQEKIDEASAALLAVPGITAVVPFHEFQGLLRGRRGGQQAVLVRGLPSNALDLDRALAGRLEFEYGDFYFNGGDSVLLGAELAGRMGARIGDEINLFSIESVFFVFYSAEAGMRVFTVGGIFRTGFYEYDMGWAVIGINRAEAFCETGPVLGLKIKNRFHDRQMLELARNSLAVIAGFETAEFTSWRDYNRSFFGALRTEKLFMFILVGLIFIVVGLNIYQSQRRAVLEHREEIGLLRAVGGGERAVRLIFVCDGAIIGFTGALAGLIPGLLIASNIGTFFTVLEKIANFFINIVNFIAGFFGAAGTGNFSFFSPTVFYIKEIPSRVIPEEVLLIFMFGFLSALTAAWFASRKVSQIQPAEVLRYE
jgi:lipoprotein-releasing system permease protein